MKFLAYFLILVGALQFASLGYDESRGATHAPISRKTGILPGTIHRQSEPENFRNAVACYCYYASAFLLLGIVMMAVGWRMDKSDPLSPDFAGNAALDDWAKAMNEEEERRKIARK